MRVLSATGIEELDRELANVLPQHGITVAGDCYSRLVLTKVAMELEADTVIISPLLKNGENDLVQVIVNLRDKGIRVIVLPGHPEMVKTQELIKKLVPYGVYDYVYDKVGIKNIIERLMKPAALGDIPKQLIDAAAMQKAGEEISEEIKRQFPENEDVKIKKKPVIDKSSNEDLASKKNIDINQKEIKVARAKKGSPEVILGIGEPRIEDWIKQNYEGRLKVLDSTVSPEEFREKVAELKPDIVILMRKSILGGIENSDQLAVWAAGHVPVILFIVGELDQAGLDMVNNARKAGITHIISCEKGGQLAGDDLNFAITSIIREIECQDIQTDLEAHEKQTISQDAKKAINNLFKGSLKVIQQTASTVAERKEKPPDKKIKKPKIKTSEGISLDENPENHIYSGQALKNPTAIVPGGIFAIVSPWKPNLAGRIAAQAVKMFREIEGGEVSYIGASAQSTGAVWLEIPDEELMMSDWRVPGSNFPIVQGNVKLYAVDPVKDLRPNSESDLWAIMKDARKTATYTVMDLAGDMDLALKVAHQGWAVVLVIIPGNDLVEQKLATLWLKNLMDGKQNIVAGVDLRGVTAGIPEELRPKVVVRNNPADALAMALRKNNNDEFHWN